MRLTRKERIVYDYEVAEYCCRWCKDRLYLFDGVPTFGGGSIPFSFCPNCGEPVTRDWED